MIKQAVEENKLSTNLHKSKTMSVLEKELMDKLELEFNDAENTKFYNLALQEVEQTKLKKRKTI